jgi:histidinol dehydrogenase
MGRSPALRIIESRNRRALERFLRPRFEDDEAFARRVRRIVERVRLEGDRALERFAERFDHVSPPLDVPMAEMQAAAAQVDNTARRAIATAAEHIARVASQQIPRHWDAAITPGVWVEQRIEPLARVGCYVPGGRFPLPSSLLMTAVPARVAGVREVVVVCPRPAPAVMAAALEAGVTTMFRVGGAHAIAALAYGTGKIARVDKIVGPGNRWVAAAKAMVAGRCAIDFYAGPTEIVVVAGNGRASWIASDLVAQAEHDPDARSIFITWNPTLARRVAAAVREQSAGRPVAERSLSAHGAVIVVRSDQDAIELANRIAPEHLVLDRESLAKRSITAGSVFIGPMAAQAAGDYAIGSNHVLPTAGAARFRGGLSAADFVRVMSVQRVTRDGLARLAPTILPLARAEGLTAHAESIEVRLRDRPIAEGPAKAGRHR